MSRIWKLTWTRRSAAAGSQSQALFAPGALVYLGGQARSFDADNGGSLVIVRRVTGNTDRSQKRSAGVKNQHTARHRNHVAVENTIHRLNEIGLLLGTVYQCARSHAQPDYGIRLAMGDPCAKLADTILEQRRNGRAARIKDEDAQRLQPHLVALGEAGICDLACLVEGNTRCGVSCVRMLQSDSRACAAAQWQPPANSAHRVIVAASGCLTA